jgi:tRNA threonylcarbamoyladenosine biosynthesis protein TsaE
MNLIINNLETINETARSFIATMGARKIFAFEGTMGAGKTTFIKAICEQLGVEDVINSPTFSIINEYHLAGSENIIYHFDFYRINSLREAYDIGVEEYFASGSLCFLEWAEKIEPLLPEETMYVNITINDDLSRTVSFV